jgi:hypothetical protein
MSLFEIFMWGLGILFFLGSAAYIISRSWFKGYFTELTNINKDKEF